MLHAALLSLNIVRENAARQRPSYGGHGDTVRQPHSWPASPGEPALRLADPGDLGALHRLYSQRHIVRNTSAPALATLAQTRAWYEQVSAQGYLLVTAAGDALAGALALKTSADPLRRHFGEISRMAVDAAWQGRGIGGGLLGAALELADGWLDLLRLELHVRSDNGAAIALYRKFGFREEGLMRGYALRDGAYADCLAMARLRGPLREGPP